MKYFLCGASALALLLSAQGAQAQEHDHSQMDHSQHPMPEDEAQLDQKEVKTGWSGLFSNDGSGTSRLPGAESGGHSGLHIDAGDKWMVMAHGYAWGVYTDQSGPRGDDKAYVQSMAMLSAERKPAGARCS